MILSRNSVIALFYSFCKIDFHARKKANIDKKSSCLYNKKESCKQNPHAIAGTTINETVAVEEAWKNEGAAKVEDLLGTKPVNKIDFKIPSFAPQIVHLGAAEGRTVK